MRAGEIFGIAGVAGNGQNALLLALSGEVIGEDGEAITHRRRAAGPARRQGAAAATGMASVPEERNGHAAVPDFTLADNSVLTGARPAAAW